VKLIAFGNGGSATDVNDLVSGYIPRIQEVQASLYHTLQSLVQSAKAVEGQQRTS
jgi:hypothetical protein